MIGFQEDILVGLRNKGVSVKYIKIIKERYERCEKNHH